jgi:hypothetical protein
MTLDRTNPARSRSLPQETTRYPKEVIPRMRHFVLAASALFMTTAALSVYAAPALQKGKPAKPAVSPAGARPKQENQFVTVDEFVQGRRSPRTAVSVEGYAVVGYRAADGSLRLQVVDSVDHVLNTKEADQAGQAGASVVVPAGVAKRPGLAWSAKGAQKFVMYTGAGHAQRPLHDIVAKVRVTGFATGKTISPATKVEVQDESGNWKTL